MLPFYVSRQFKILLRIPFLNKYYSRIKRKNTRLYMRGYEKAKKELGLDFLTELYIDLSKLYIPCNTNLEEFLDKTNFNLKYSLRQFVISRILNCGDYSLKKILFKAIEDGKPISYSLPLEYILKLEQKGFRVNKFSSLTLWRILILFEFLQGIKQAFLYIFRNIFNKINNVNIKRVDVYFLGLNSNILPSKFQRKLNGQCFNYFGKKFYKQKYILFGHGINIKNKILGHNVKLEYKRYPFGYLTSWFEILELIYFLFIQIINFPINIFSNKLGSTILLNELFFAKVCSLQKKKFLAKTYLFDNSFIFRPIWTYIAEKKRSEIIFYFISTNCVPRKKAETSLLVLFSYRNLNWPNYVFWNKYQEKIFKKFLEKPYSISISGPICFHNKELKANFKLPNRTISVFDIPIRRDSVYKSFGNPDEYYTPKYFFSFLKDILLICEKNDITLCLKSKRDLGKSTAHPSYIKFIKSISNNANVLIIPHETSPYDLIKKTDVSIAIPFTSTPHFSKVLKKPSCYYDSSGFITKNNKGAMGVEIIVGLNQLNSWVLKKINF